MIELTDADRAAILATSGYTSFTDYGREYATKLYLAGLAAGIARERERCATLCEEIDRARPHTEHLDALDCAAAIRGIAK